MEKVHLVTEYDGTVARFKCTEQPATYLAGAEYLIFKRKRLLTNEDEIVNGSTALCEVTCESCKGNKRPSQKAVVLPPGKKWNRTKVLFR